MLNSFDKIYKDFLFHNGLAILIILLITVVLGFIIYLIFLYRKNNHKTLFILTLQFPEISEESEVRFGEKMQSVFSTLYRLVLSQTDKLFLEVFKTGEYITMQLGSNNKRVLEQAKVAFSHIDSVQLRETTNDEIENISPLFAKQINVSKKFYAISKNDDFFSGVIHFLSSLQASEKAGIQIVLRGVNKKLTIQEKMNGLIYKARKEKRQLTDLENVLLHMYQTKQMENLFKVKINILSNEKSILYNMSTLFSSLNLSNNTFSSYKESCKKILSRFISPETLISSLPVFGSKQGIYLTSSELSCLFHPTSVMRGIYAPKQTKSIEATPEFLTEKEDNILIGQVEDQNGNNKEIFYPIKNFVRHLYIIGKTGKGKSTFLIQIICSLLKKTKSTLFVFDPHGDLVEDILKQNSSKNLIYLNIAGKDRVFTFNPIFAFGKSDNEKASLREGLLDIIKNETEEQAGNNTSGVATFQRIKQIIDIGIEFADAYYLYLTKEKKIEPQRAKEIVSARQLTLNDLPYLLFKEMDYIDTIQEIFKNNDSEVGIYVSKLYESHTKQYMVAEAVQTRLEQLLHSSLRLIYEGNKLNIKNVTTNGKTFLIPVPETTFGAHGSKALLQSLFFLIWDYKRRQKERSNTYIFIDEFQKAQIKDIPEIIAEGRKYKLFLILSNQQLGQLKQTIKDSIFGNMGTVVSFTVSPDEIGAKTLAPFFGNGVKEEDLINLPPFTAFMKTEGDNNKPLATFSFETIEPDKKPTKVNVEEINNKSLEEYGERVEDIKARLSRKQKNPLEYFLGDVSY